MLNSVSAVRGRLFARNPAAWLLALFHLRRLLRSASADDIVTSEGGALSGMAEISGLP